MVYKVDWKSLIFDMVNTTLNDIMTMPQARALQNMIQTKIASVYAT